MKFHWRSNRAQWCEIGYRLFISSVIVINPIILEPYWPSGFFNQLDREWLVIIPDSCILHHPTSSKSDRGLSGFVHASHKIFGARLMDCGTFVFVKGWSNGFLSPSSTWACAPWSPARHLHNVIYETMHVLTLYSPQFAISRPQSRHSKQSLNSSPRYHLELANISILTSKPYHHDPTIIWLDYKQSSPWFEHI